MNNKKESSKSKSARLAREYRSQFIQTTSNLLTSAFGLVAAFAWNDLVRQFISKYISQGNSFVSQLIYAILVTILAVSVSFQFGKLAARYKIDEDKK